MPADRSDAPRARHPERFIALLTLVAGLPAVGVAMVLLWRSDFPAELRWTAVVVVVGVWIAAASAARQVVSRTLNLIANLLGALREGDYSIRGLAAPPASALSLVMREVNDLGATLQRQRAEALESTALLTHVMEEIGVAVFAFDPDNRLLLVNKAGAVLIGTPHGSSVGATAAALDFEKYLTGESRRLIDRSFGGRRGRYEMRRAQFYRNGRRHFLIVMTDVSQALREEEQAAWQRIVRVLSHEINNSLTPIKSIAHSLRRIVDRGDEGARATELRDGLVLIEERSGALGRFLRAYAQLARLPKPQPTPVRIGALIGRIAELESRVPVIVEPSPEIEIEADSDQLEQLLINVIRNAVDASVDRGGAVAVRWRRRDRWLEVEVDDEGTGLAETANLFVPFFTTKPNGSGIGLALGRQIAEAHEGSLTLENRVSAAGCRATVRLPLRPAGAAVSRGT